VIAAAAGRATIDVARGAFRGRFMNVLVTDVECATGLLAR
jgi:DNA-binding transcriptional regulator LsrR (DeoR family)